jgi:peptidoglycan/LPS O-acetylase OafA/YrhL
MGVEVRAPVAGLVRASSTRLESLTALRFVAALLVFGNHIGDTFLAEGSRLNRVLQTGFVGVSFFFVLSGFVLTWTWRPDDRALLFYRRRIARVVPNHLVAWGVALALAVATGLHLSATGVASSLSLLQAWHPDPSVHFAVNPVVWTLSVEVFFYLAFPAIVGPLRRLDRCGCFLVMAACVAVSVGWAVVGHIADPGARHWVVYVFPLARLPEFVLGILLAFALRAGDLRRVSLSLALALAAVAWAVGLGVPRAFHVAAVTLVPFALVVVAAAQRDLQGRRSRLLRTRTLVRLGEWSFAFYLLHELVIRGATAAFDLDRLAGPAVVGAVTVLLITSVLASGALARFVERPTEARLRGTAR